MESPFAVLSLLANALEQNGITYVLVGSLASSMHGMYRSTADIDIVADVKAAQVMPLLAALQQEFYVDENAIKEAVNLRKSFNAIHFNSVFKVDIFIPKSDEFSMKQLERRQLKKLSPDLEQQIYVATAEDTILAKLRWYESANQASTVQWRDVIGILAASSKKLDFNYLRQWAIRLRVHELLEKAIAEAK
jgi:hypothetical protein